MAKMTQHYKDYYDILWVHSALALVMDVSEL